MDALHNLEKEVKSKGTTMPNKPKAKNADLIEQRMKEVMDWLQEDDIDYNTFIMLVYGVDGTMKTGFLMEYLARAGKETLYLDIDGNSKRIKTKFHKDSKIHVKNPIKTRYEVKEGRVTAVIDYIETFNTIQLALKAAADNPGMYDAVVIDGLSTLLDYAMEQTKVEKHINADGNIAVQYYQLRKKYFLGVLEITRAIEKADKFFIGHDDFINVPGTTSINLGGKTVQLEKTSKPVQATNRMMDQRVYMELEIDNIKKTESYYATIHKWRDDGAMVNEKYLIGEKSEGHFEFHEENVMKVFDGKLESEVDEVSDKQE